MKTKNYDELEIIILKNLCVVVGMEYNKDMFLIPNWNKLNKWTIYERQCFNLWLSYFLSKNLELTSEQAKRGSIFFTDRFGWEIGFRSEIAHGFVKLPYRKEYKHLYLQRYEYEQKT